MPSTSLLKSLVTSWKYLIPLFLCTLTLPLVVLFLISDIDFENIDTVIYIFGNTYLFLNTLILYFIFRKKIRLFSNKKLVSSILFLICSLFTADILWYAFFEDFLHEFGLGILFLSFIGIPQISYIIAGLNKLEVKILLKPLKPSLLGLVIQTAKIGISLSPIYYCITYADFTLKEDVIFTASVGTFGLWLLSKVDYSIFIYLFKSIISVIVSLYIMAFSKEPTQIVISFVKEETKPKPQPKPKYESFVFYRSPQPAQIEPCSLTWTLGSDKLNNIVTNTLLGWVGISPKIIKHKTFWTFYSLTTVGLALLVELLLVLIILTQYVNGIFSIISHILLSAFTGIFVLFQINKHTLKEKLNVALKNIDVFSSLDQKSREKVAPSWWIKIMDKILKVFIVFDFSLLFLTLVVYFVPPGLQMIENIRPFISFRMKEDIFITLLSIGMILLLLLGWISGVIDRITFINKATNYAKTKK